MAARLIDFAVVGTLWYAAGWAVFSAIPAMAAIVPLLCAGVVIAYLYEVRLSRGGHSLGKRLLGHYVLRVDSGPVDRALLVRRWAVMYTAALVWLPFSTVVSALWLLRDRPHHQGIHDKAVGTVVVGSDPGPVAATAAAPAPAVPTGAPAGVVPAGVVLASWGRRVASTTIDISPLLGAFGMEKILGAAIDPGGRWVGIVLQWAALIWMIFNQVQAGTTGQSLGKRAGGLRLVRERDGLPLGGGMAVLRWFMHILDSWAFFIGFLWPLWDRKRQTLADKIMQSLVIRLHPTVPAT